MSNAGINISAKPHNKLSLNMGSAPMPAYKRPYCRRYRAQEECARYLVSRRHCRRRCFRKRALLTRFSRDGADCETFSSFSRSTERAPGTVVVVQLLDLQRLRLDHNSASIVSRLNLCKQLTLKRFAYIEVIMRTVNISGRSSPIGPRFW